MMDNMLVTSPVAVIKYLTKATEGKKRLSGILISGFNLSCWDVTEGEPEPGKCSGHPVSSVKRGG